MNGVIKLRPNESVVGVVGYLLLVTLLRQKFPFFPTDFLKRDCNGVLVFIVEYTLFALSVSDITLFG